MTQIIKSKMPDRDNKGHFVKGGNLGHPQFGGIQKSHPRKEKVKYVTQHERVAVARGKPTKCEHCGTTNPTKRYEWSCKDHKNYDDIDNFQRLCSGCHFKYDIKKGLHSKNWQKQYQGSK